MEWQAEKLLVLGLAIMLISGTGSTAFGNDFDSDGVKDFFDKCPYDADPCQYDDDGDGVGDICDNCPGDGNPNQDDSDGDGMGNACDQCDATPAGHAIDPNGCSDTDADGINGEDDNCPDDSNPGQEDGDADGFGDECDLCSRTDPRYEKDVAGPADTVTSEGCADRDSDRVSDYRDQCAGSSWQYPVNELGCDLRARFKIESSTGDLLEFWEMRPSPCCWFQDPSLTFVDGAMTNPYEYDCLMAPDPCSASGHWSDNAYSVRHKFPDPCTVGDPDTQVWFRPYANGTVRLWDKSDIDTWQAVHDDPCQACPFGGDGPIPPYSYDYYPCPHPTDAGSTVIGVAGPEVTVSLIDSDLDGIVDASDNCPDTPVGAVLDPCDLGCALPDTDGDGVPDDDDQCNDPCTWVDQDGCPDADRDGVGNTNDDCAGSPLGTTVSLEGCSDADGDGVYVPYDKCEDTPGGSPVNVDGCKDTDGDEVPDTDDLCNDPCGWVDEDGCPDRDLDGVADTDDNCPDQDGQGCPDGCPDPGDSDGDGVPDCLDICDDPCTWVDVNGCPDADRDGVADANDLCYDASTPLNEVVGTNGCFGKEMLIETDGPLWFFSNGRGHDRFFHQEAGVPPYIVPCPLVNNPNQGADASKMGFGSGFLSDTTATAYFRVYPDGTARIWDEYDVAYWQRLRNRPGGDPLTGGRTEIEPLWYDHRPFPTTPTQHTVDEGAPPYHPGSLNITVVDNADTDGDGVRDFFDLCPDSNLLEHDVDEVGCPVWPRCNDRWRPSPGADVDVDCYVNEEDLIAMAEQWLSCVDPLGEGCIQLQPSPEEMHPDIMYMQHCWTKNVDGVLGDWPDPCWVALDKIYTGDPNDVLSAKYAVCWDPCDDLFYAAVQVVDTDHVFETAPTNWNTSDRVEIYVQADPNGGDNWGSIGNENYDKAQQYIVGYQGLLDWTWAVFGHGTYLPGDFEPFNAHFADAGRISGDTITYEISAKAWQWYGGITPAVDPNVVRQLEPGVQVGFDVVADTRWGSAPHDDDDEFGAVSANLDTNKYIFAEKFQRWELLDYDGAIVPPECGDWGYLTADIKPAPDCYVDMGDFEELTSQWMGCTDPCAPCGFIP